MLLALMIAESVLAPKAVSTTAIVERGFVNVGSNLTLPTTLEHYWLTVWVYWSNGLPFRGARVEVYNYTTGDLISVLETDATGSVRFLLPAFQLYRVNVTAINPYNISDIYRRMFIVNLTDNRDIMITLPWTPEEIKQFYMFYVYAYDVVNGSPVEGATVVMSYGSITWADKTNASGYATFKTPFLGHYSVTAIHPNYQAVSREVLIFENNTIINLPMSPIYINFNQIPPPPLNGSEYPPIVINGTPHYWLSVQVPWSDGYPFHGANVTVYDYATGKVIASGMTNGTGFIHFLIPANKTIRYTVDAVNPYNASQTYHDERVVTMSQHYYFVHKVPWISPFFSPEVGVASVEFVAHEGLGCYYGENVSHLVIVDLYSNVKQTVNVTLSLFNVTGGFWVENKTYTFDLTEGVNEFFAQISINACNGGRFRVLANITGYQYDSDPRNNALWSNEVFLRPFADFYVAITFRDVEKKQPWTRLPGDIIEVDICFYIPVPIETPANISWSIYSYDLKAGTFRFERGGAESVTAEAAGMICRNETITVSWTSRIVVNASIHHEWDVNGFNNEQTMTIPVDPNIVLQIVSAPSIVREGEKFKVVVNLTSNVEPGMAMATVTLFDNTTVRILAMVDISVEPEMIVELEATAPEIPANKQAEVHQIEVTVSGYDSYVADNTQSFQLVILSNKQVSDRQTSDLWMYLTIAVTAVAIAVVAIAVALKVIASRPSK